MKSYIFLLTLFFTAFTIQSQDIEGTYANKWVSNSGEGIEYTLTIMEDGQFNFIYRRLLRDSNNEPNIEVHGTWDLNGHLLVLNTEDTDNSISTGLNSNKAKFVSVSPRHPKFNMIKPSLKFYESEIFYAKDMELIKTEEKVTSTEGDVTSTIK